MDEGFFMGLITTEFGHDIMIPDGLELEVELQIGSAYSGIMIFMTTGKMVECFYWGLS